MKSFALLSFSSLASAMCNYGTTLFPREAEGEKFAYHELSGPLNWHGLSPENHLCADGTNQSPINVVHGSIPCIGGSSLGFEAPAVEGAEFENLGTTVQVFVNGSITLRETSYALRQFHFHTPSEHHIDGEYFPAEVHFVFQDADESVAVVGVPIEIASGDNPVSTLLTSVLGHVGEIPAAGDATITDALDFFELQCHLADAEVFQYSGSLTTPPCSQNVSWNLARQPLFIDVTTFLALKRVVKFNSRYTQDAPGQINLLDNARNVLDG